MEKDIEERIAADFPDRAAEAQGMIDALIYDLKVYTASERERNRIARCVIVLAERDFSLLTHYIGAARKDYRDVLLWAEQEVFEGEKPFPQG